MTINKIQHVSPTPGLSSSSPSIVKGSTQSKGDDVLLTGDMSTRDILGQILIELKKLNLRQEIAFGEQVNDGDVL